MAENIRGKKMTLHSPEGLTLDDISAFIQYARSQGCTGDMKPTVDTNDGNLPTWIGVTL